MDYGNLWGFILAAIALIASPGPATMSLAGLGAAFSFSESRRFLFGTYIGGSIVSISVGAGLLTVVLAVPYATNVLLILSSAIMIYIAFKIATGPPLEIKDKDGGAPGFTAGLLLNLFNPKAYVSFAAPFSTYELIPGTPSSSIVIEVVITLLILAVFNPIWFFLGNRLQTAYRKTLIARSINITFALLLILSVLGVVLWSQMTMF